MDEEQLKLWVETLVFARLEPMIGSKMAHDVGHAVAEDLIETVHTNGEENEKWQVVVNDFRKRHPPEPEPTGGA